MIISSLVATKLIFGLAKEMVSFKITERLASNLLDTGKQILLNGLNKFAPEIQGPLRRRLAAANEAAHPDESEAKISTEYLVHNWLEALFAWFQMVVLWHEPLVSLCTISGLLSSFLLLTYFTPKFYATVMIAIFVYNLTKVWFRHVWPEIRLPPSDLKELEQRLDVDRWTHLHPQLMTLAELGELIRKLMGISELQLEKLSALRSKRPISFCLLICSILSCTAYIGNRFSGSTLTFCFIAAIILAPGIYLHLVPNQAKDYLESNHRFIKFRNQIFPNATETIGSPAPKSVDVAASEKDEEQATLAANQLVTSDDLSSNESASLVDLDEEQQDGFVILG